MATRSILFFVSALCEECAKWKPLIEEFRRRHGAKTLVLVLNPNLQEYSYALADSRRTWHVRAWPSMAVKEGSEVIRYREGVQHGETVTIETLEQFAFQEQTS